MLAAMARAIECVWVVRRRDLFPRCSPQGFLQLAPDELERDFLRVARHRGFFVERREAEVTPAWKQLIPYCLVRFEGRFLLFERLAAQGETRLHGKLSIGVGGHLNPVDAEPGGDLIVRGARRELAEELRLDSGIELTPLGLLNDDQDPVGAVHVGVVFGVGPSREPEIRERHKMRGVWTPLAELRDMWQTRRPFESWSAEILRVRGWETGF